MVWIQYRLIDGARMGTNSQRVDDAILANLGRAQIECPDDMDATQCMVDISGNSPVVILEPVMPEAVAGIP